MNATPRYPKRLIEVDLPIKKISEHARKEKSIRSGHISTIHIWWARRPLAACRAVLCAALWPDPVDSRCPEIFRTEAKNQMRLFWNQMDMGSRKLDDSIALRKALLDFIADYADWENSTKDRYLNTARKITQIAYIALGGDPKNRPLIVDPFAGGGAIPLEALRVGGDIIANDLNPIAYEINKVIVEDIPKYHKSFENNVEKYGKLLLANLRNELIKFYPLDEEGKTQVGYLWARTILCEGPNCGYEVPIIRNQKISENKKNETTVEFSYENKQLKTKLLFGRDASKIDGGTSKRSSVTCPRSECGYTTKRKNVEIQSKKSGFGFLLYAVCVRDKNGVKKYRDPTARDFQILDKVNIEIEKKINCEVVSGTSFVPNEELPYLRSIFNVRVYGIDKWSKLFTNRQLLSNIILIEQFRKISILIKEEIRDPKEANEIINCLALAYSNSIQYQCNIATYLTEGVKSAFIQGQSLPMKMDFIEANPLIEDLAGGYEYSFSQHISGLKYLSSFDYPSGITKNQSALNNLSENRQVDLLFTDPPYYDVVPYADCSDFFYVWLRRMLINNSDFPCKQILTPKDDEIVQLAERNQKYAIKTKKWFETKLKDVFSIYRNSINPTGISIIVFAHKGTAAWEAFINSILLAGWIVVGSWPIDTEKATRMRANESAVLGSSIHLICRPRNSQSKDKNIETVGDWSDILQELPPRIHEWMPRLTSEGVVGADAIFACLGPALEIYSRYSRVEKPNGEQVLLREYLEKVWEVVAKEALTVIFADVDTSGFEEDSRLTAMWLWTLSSGGDQNLEKSAQVDDNDDESESDKKTGSKDKKKKGFFLEYDAARKIAQGLGAHPEEMTTLVEVKGEIARLLPVSERAQFLFGKQGAKIPVIAKKKGKQMTLEESAGDEAETAVAEARFSLDTQFDILQGKTVLDSVHQSMLLFGAGRSDALKTFLIDNGAGKDPRFWRLAQALSALYPITSEEKRWVDGVLARKKGLGL